MPYLTKVIPNPEPIDCKILTAALELFVSSGFHKVSIQEIQKKADVSIGSIYNHFGGKEGIAKELYSHLLNEMNEMIDLVLKEKENSIDRCSRIIELLFEYSETRTSIISYIFYSKHSEYITGGEPICSAETFKKLRRIIEQGMDEGEIKKIDCFVAYSVIFGGAIRMIQLRFDGVIEKPLTEYSDEFLSAMWTGLSLK